MCRVQGYFLPSPYSHGRDCKIVCVCACLLPSYMHVEAHVKSVCRRSFGQFCCVSVICIVTTCPPLCPETSYGHFTQGEKCTRDNTHTHTTVNQSKVKLDCAVCSLRHCFEMDSFEQSSLPHYGQPYPAVALDTAQLDVLGGRVEQSSLSFLERVKGHCW